MKYLIIPSIFSADISCLYQEISSIISIDIHCLHFDIMDNHYVPNLTLGPIFCNMLYKKFPSIQPDIHLMTTPVDNLIIDFAKIGAKRIIIHSDSTTCLNNSLNLIKKVGCQAGLALNPNISPYCIAWNIKKIDFVVVMTVYPGLSGQSFIKDMIHKIKWIKNNFPKLTICVDGGVNINNIKELYENGVNQFVLGSTIFSSRNYYKTIQNIKNILNL